MGGLNAENKDSGFPEDPEELSWCSKKSVQVHPGLTFRLSFGVLGWFSGV